MVHTFIGYNLKVLWYCRAYVRNSTNGHQFCFFSTLQGSTSATPAKQHNKLTGQKHLATNWSTDQQSSQYLHRTSLPSQQQNICLLILPPIQLCPVTDWSLIGWVGAARILLMRCEEGALKTQICLKSFLFYSYLFILDIHMYI